MMLHYVKAEEQPLEELGLSPHGYNKPAVVVTRTFFRDAAQCNPFWENLGDRLVKVSVPGKPMKILSVGCASGEETYSIAMVARKAGLDVRVEGIDIVATNIRLAQEGRYPIDPELDQDFLLTIPFDYRDCFAQDGSKWRALPEIREMVGFRTGDVRSMNEWNLRADVIISRRLFDHFTPEMRLAVYDKFRNAAPLVHVSFVPEEQYIDPAAPRVSDIHLPDPVVYAKHLGNF